MLFSHQNTRISSTENCVSQFDHLYHMCCSVQISMEAVQCACSFCTRVWLVKNSWDLAHTNNSKRGDVPVPLAFQECISCLLLRRTIAHFIYKIQLHFINSYMDYFGFCQYKRCNKSWKYKKRWCWDVDKDTSTVAFYRSWCHDSFKLLC